MFTAQGRQELREEMESSSIPCCVPGTAEVECAFGPEGRGQRSQEYGLAQRNQGWPWGVRVGTPRPGHFLGPPKAFRHSTCPTGHFPCCLCVFGRRWTWPAPDSFTHTRPSAALERDPDSGEHHDAVPGPRVHLRVSKLSRQQQSNARPSSATVPASAFLGEQGS